MRTPPFLLLILSVALACQPSDNKAGAAGLPPAEKDTCNSPDAHPNCSFNAMPAGLTNTVNIAGSKEPGDRMTLQGQLLHADGKTPYAGVKMFLYHTNAKGIYPKKDGDANIHGYLHGWLVTGSDGGYTIETIRPAPYPNGNMPAHVHAIVWVPGAAEAYYVSDFVFADDPFVNDT
jgi:protocatechuate 3,4-dioxygenase, beta subunit